MPYLAFDLDAKKRVPRVARALGVEPGIIAWGLLEIWEHAWEAKADVVTDLTLTCCFGPTNEVRAALVDQGFIEQVESGWRIRGASRYLRISQTRSDAGKTRTASAKRDARGRLVAGECAGEPEAPASKSPAHAGEPASSGLALTPSTQHPTPNLDSKTLSSAGASAPPLQLISDDERAPDPADEVLGYYVEALGANGFRVEPTPKRRKLVARALKFPGCNVAKLKRAVDGLTWSDWHMGRDARSNGKAWPDIKYALDSPDRIEERIRDMETQTQPKARRL